MATTFQPKAGPTSVGLPPNTTLLEFGRWLLAGGPDVEAHIAWVQSLGAEVGMQHLATMEAAVELAETSTDAASYLTDPVGWIERYVEFPEGESLTPYQAEALATLAEHHRLALRGGHGLGKSAAASLTVLWFAFTREAAGIDWKIPTTASAWRQITHYLWPEIHKWAGRIRWELMGRGPLTQNELQTLRLKLDHGEAWGQAAKDANSIEGAHATHLLYLFDESKGIAPNLWTAAEGAFSGAGRDTKSEAWFLALSVPGPPAGTFYDIHTRKPGYEDWKVRHVRKEEVIAAGRMSADWADMMRRRFGVKSSIYQQRVEGNFATDATNAVIPLEWIEAANERWLDRAERGVDLGPILGAGLDVAREGGDVTVLAMTTFDTVLPLIRPTEFKTQPLVAKVKVELSRYPGRPVVAVDAEGIGAGIFDGLSEGIDWQDRVLPFKASNSPPGNWHDYTGQLTMGNARSCIWWALRDELNPDRADFFVPTLALPPDDLLTGDLTVPTFYFGAGGRIFIESKDDIRKRLGRSSDSADAVCQARWALVLGARATVTAAQHKARAGTSSGDLRRGADAAGPGGGEWSPLRVAWLRRAFPNPASML